MLCKTGKPDTDAYLNCTFVKLDQFERKIAPNKMTTI